jgi:protein involved in polysaccharide export with SLBB domain
VNGVRKVVSALMVVCLLAPALAAAQPQQPAAPPRPPGAFVPFTPSRADLAQTPFSGRSIAGPDYRLGPGDVLDVQIAGRLDVSRVQVVVDPEGAVNIPPLGAILVGGLSLLDANRQIGERARMLLRYADVSLAVVAPRLFEIVLSGEVERPGTIQVTATQRLHEVLLSAGGVTPRGSVRHVRLTLGGVEREVDLLAFELRGDVSENPYVQESLRVHVPPRGPAVVLAGAVRRPGEYELGAQGSLREVLELTGGLAAGGAGGDARLTRVGADGRKETVPLDLRAALAPGADLRLRAGDLLFVPPLSVIQDVVEVRGAFNGTDGAGKTTTTGKPTIVQRFELAQGERVRDVVLKAGGTAAFADLRLAFVERGAPTGPRQRIPVDLHRLLVDKDDTHNIQLQNGDVLTLPVTEDKVYVVGEVRAPGAHDFRPDLTPREYVALAGGPAQRAKVAATVVTFRNGRTFPMSQAPPLEPGAVVTVPEVALKWWQDYVQLATIAAGLITAYTGLYVLFGGNLVRGITENKFDQGRPTQGQ